MYYYCGLCLEHFKEETKWSKHWNTLHSTGYTCFACRTPTLYDGNIRDHLVNFHGRARKTIQMCECCLHFFGDRERCRAHEASDDDDVSEGTHPHLLARSPFAAKTLSRATTLQNEAFGLKIAKSMFGPEGCYQRKFEDLEAILAEHFAETTRELTRDEAEEKRVVLFRKVLDEDVLPHERESVVKRMSDRSDVFSRFFWMALEPPPDPEIERRIAEARRRKQLEREAAAAAAGGEGEPVEKKRRLEHDPTPSTSTSDDRKDEKEATTSSESAEKTEEKNKSV